MPGGLRALGVGRYTWYGHVDAGGEGAMLVQRGRARVKTILGLAICIGFFVCFLFPVERHGPGDTTRPGRKAAIGPAQSCLLGRGGGL